MEKTGETSSDFLEAHEIDDLFTLSESKDVDVEVDKLLAYYRVHGFPDYEIGADDVAREFHKLQRFDERTIFHDGEIGQSMLGCGILWKWFPHWKEVLCGNQKSSIIEMWNDDDALRKLLKKTYLWKLRHGERIWNANRIRQNAKVFLAGQSVSNFRPTVAKYIYNRFGGDSVFDMSCGYGGRFFGFCASTCRRYEGCDPCTKTYNGLVAMGEEMEPLMDGKEFVFHKSGSEVFIPDCEGRFDLCFTSPPYFNTEKYSDEETQSWRKYDAFDGWCDGFLRRTIENCWQYLKDDGFMIINIADTPSVKGLESNTMRMAVETGFHHLDTYKMVLSSVAGKGKKFEPVFIFGKNRLDMPDEKKSQLVLF